MFQFNIVFGILIALVSNWVFKQAMDMETAWRWMLGIEAVPALIYTLLSFTLPESPRWLITHAKKREEGKQIFRRINEDASDEELEKLAVEIEESATGTRATSRFWTARLKIPIMLAILISLFNQFSGINVVFYYAPRLLGLAGLEDTLKASILLGLTNLGFTFVGLWLIDKLGRRSLLYVGSIGYIVSLAVCALVFMSTPTLEVASTAKDLADTAGTLVKIEKKERFITPEERKGFDVDKPPAKKRRGR